MIFNLIVFKLIISPIGSHHTKRIPNVVDHVVQ